MRIVIIGFGERFIRMWDSHLTTCEAAFADRKLGTLQLVLSRSGEQLRPASQPVGAPADVFR
jgi:hypothetical protein